MTASRVCRPLPVNRHLSEGEQTIMSTAASSRRRFARHAPALVTAAVLTLAGVGCSSSPTTSSSSSNSASSASSSVPAAAGAPSNSAASPPSTDSSTAAASKPGTAATLTPVQQAVQDSLKFARPSIADKNVTIGLAQISTTIPFLATLDTAFEDEAARLGMKTVVLNANLQDSKQSSNVEDLIARKVSVILVDGGTPSAINSALKDANKAGIPVIAVNAAISGGPKVVTYAGASDFDYGVGEGNLIVQGLPNGGKIAIILGILGGTPQVQRLAGIQSVLKNHPAITVVSTPSDNFDNSKNLSVTQDLLSKYPKGSLDGIVAQGPEMYVGAKYARSVGRDDLVFVAGDYSTQVEAAIKSGAIFGTVNQDPALEGKLGADYAYDVITGNTARIPAPNALIPLPLITKTNVEANPANWSG